MHTRTHTDTRAQTYARTRARTHTHTHTHTQHNPPPASGGGLTAPDGGCVCYCLRTGFSSSQGKLVRMIEFSQEKVRL
jgi:hypothetical protein